MDGTKPTIGQRLRNNWLELLVLATAAAALAWIGLTARGVWQIVAAEPTATATAPPAAAVPPAPRPVASGTPALRDTFDGQLALARTEEMVSAGPRNIGSEGHLAAIGAVISELRADAWGLQQQSFNVDDVQHTNIIARSGAGDIIVIAAHYDTSPASDRDPAEENWPTPSPGANDGGAGAALLLELARALNKDQLDNQVWLAFLDGRYAVPGEDGQSQVADAGVHALAEALPETVKAVILVDQVGHRDQRFAIFPNGDPQLAAELWAIAERLGYSRWFTPQSQESTESSLDAFTALGVPATAISDLSYPFARSTEDTTDKLTASGLERVGRVLEVYLEGQE